MIKKTYAAKEDTGETSEAETEEGAALFARYQPGRYRHLYSKCRGLDNHCDLQAIGK